MNGNDFKKKILYISYDGMLEPLGQSQVLSYLTRIALSAEVHIISFEKSNDWANSEEKIFLTKQIENAGITWYPLRYHKRPSALATAYDIVCGTVLGLWLIFRRRINIVHARSYVASVIALMLKRITGVKYVFDMRGFWADERVDGNLWPRAGRMYRVAKWFEKRFLLKADHVVSLTHAAVNEMQHFPYLLGRMPPVTVIPTCADLERFKPIQDGRQDGFVMGYVGSAGTWYEFDATVVCFAELLRLKPDAQILIVNRNEHDYICERLAAGGVPLASVELVVANHAEVPMLLARMHASVFFIKPVFSKQASAPTKLAELLGSGIPCLVNCGVGDMAELIKGEQVGVAVNDFSPQALRTGLVELLEMMKTPGMQDRCVSAAQKHFSLDEGVRRYEQVYRCLDEKGKLL
jgi:glycosyltransferase involved in cell wall biosynthesis